MRLLLKPGISRRGLLGSFVGATLGVAGFAYPGLGRVLTTHALAGRSTAPAAPEAKDPSFWSGQVSAKRPARGDAREVDKNEDDDEQIRQHPHKLWLSSMEWSPTLSGSRS